LGNVSSVERSAAQERDEFLRGGALVFRLDPGFESMNRTNFGRYGWRVLTLSMSLVIARGACGYDFPLSESAIRDAYFLGTKGPSQGRTFLGEYTHAVNQFKVGACTSEISLETPFAHIAIHASKTPNYSAQDAVKEFLGKPAVFRMHLDICYLAGALENVIKVTVLQNKRSIRWTYENRSAYYPPSDESTQVSNNGERIDLEFPADRIDSSELTIRIDTPDGQHADTVFALESLR
jgi:hypothetical protein